MGTNIGVIVFVSVALVSYLLVYGLRRWAMHRNILDIPNQRSSHTTPTPRGGGLAMSALVIVVGVLIILWRKDLSLLHALTYLAGGLVISALGFIDDMKTLPAKVRFGIQGGIALLTIVGIGYFDQVSVPILGNISLGVFGIVLTIIWIVGLTNAYNFMDGSNGLAAGVAICAALGWAWLSKPDSFVFYVSLAIAASALGFLAHNWTPARIFMGDVGSTFLGYSFAVLPLLVKDEMPSAAVVGALLMWVFIFDTGFTIIRRWRRHENLLAAHRSHLYQRLIISGFSHPFIAVMYMALTILGVVLAFLVIQNDAAANVIIVVSLIVIAFGLWLLVRLQENHLPLQNTKPNS